MSLEKRTVTHRSPTKSRKQRRRWASTMIREIGRILVSLLLLVLVGFLYWMGFGSVEAALKLGMTNLASVILGAELTYWLKP